MKRFMTGLLQGRIMRWSMLAGVAALLVWAWPATAGQKQNVEIVATYLASDWGQASVTPSGNIHLRNMGATCMMVSDNPLVTGRLTWVGNANADAEMNAVGSGTGVFEVGTWDLSDPRHPVFIPSPAGGLWVTKWEMKGQFPVSYAGKVMAHGVAGEVEGMQCALAGQGGGGVDYYSGTLLDPPAQAGAGRPVERPFKSEATVTWTVNVLDGSATGHHVGVATHGGLFTAEASVIWNLDPADFRIVSGTGVSTTANDDVIFWKMTEDQPMVVQFDGGTGRFENVTGSAATVYFTLLEMEVVGNTMTMTLEYALEGTITY